MSNDDDDDDNDDNDGKALLVFPRSPNPPLFFWAERINDNSSIVIAFALRRRSCQTDI
jgi:hypothetical protein